jgi:hypothetical protein
MARTNHAEEALMSDQPVPSGQPRRVEPIFDASGTLRRVRIERPQTSEAARAAQQAERN